MVHRDERFGQVRGRLLNRGANSGTRGRLPAHKQEAQVRPVRTLDEQNIISSYIYLS